jgi:hypothetical protein
VAGSCTGLVAALTILAELLVVGLALENVLEGNEEHELNRQTQQKRKKEYNLGLLFLCTASFFLIGQLHNIYVCNYQ